MKVRLQAKKITTETKHNSVNTSYNINVSYYGDVFIYIVNTEKNTSINVYTIKVIFIYKNVTYVYKYIAVKKPSNGQPPYGIGVIKDLNGKIFYDAAVKTDAEAIAVHSAILDIIQLIEKKINSQALNSYNKTLIKC